DLTQIPGFTMAPSKKGVGVFFGRSPAKTKMMLFARAVAKRLGEKPGWIPWFLWYPEERSYRIKSQVNGFRAGSESPLKRSQGEADRSFSRTADLVRFAHLCLHILGDGFVEGSFHIRELVVDSVSLPFRKQRSVIELDEFFLHHAAHQIARINDLVDAVAILAVETIRIEQ